MSTKPHLSKSQIELYGQCGEKYRRRYIDREESVPSVALHLGTSVHHAIEQACNARIQKADEPTPSEMAEMAKLHFDMLASTEGVGEDETDDEVEKGHADAGILTTLWANEVFPGLQPEAVELEVRIVLDDSPYDLLGYIDIVDREGFVRDTKTSKKKKQQREVDHSLQMSIYAAAYSLLYGMMPSGVVLDVLVNKKKPEYQYLESVRNSKDMRSLAHTVTAVSEGIQAGVFPPANPASDWWCSPKWCEFYGDCRYISERVVQIGMSRKDDE